MEFFTNNVNLFAGGGASAIALWLLKRIPNDDLYSWVIEVQEHISAIAMAGPINDDSASFFKRYSCQSTSRYPRCFARKNERS